MQKNSLKTKTAAKWQITCPAVIAGKHNSSVGKKKQGQKEKEKKMIGTNCQEREREGGQEQHCQNPEDVRRKGKIEQMSSKEDTGTLKD